ncbi:hypothetical protein [Herpetosiphon sp. NSE202]|uniref:hypothetical protein n=1 Tax=Herpetosiphon sp. NSE202 TaxID=3351349 RepID=UPI00363AE16A
MNGNSSPIECYIERQLRQQLKQRNLYAKADQQRFDIESSLQASALSHFFRSELLAQDSPLVHLFAAMPAALAVCFGRQLNACHYNAMN